jgi:DNA mismatch repair ATPase MutL
MKKLSNSYCHLQCGMSDDEKIDDEESTQCSSNAKIVGDIFIKEGFNLCQIIGNFGNAFIICYYDGKIYLVDQHAASEKSLYMRFIEEKKLLPSAYEGNIF